MLDTRSVAHWKENTKMFLKQRTNQEISIRNIDLLRNTSSLGDSQFRRLKMFGSWTTTSPTKSQTMAWQSWRVDHLSAISSTLEAQQLKFTGASHRHTSQTMLDQHSRPPPTPPNPNTSTTHQSATTTALALSKTRIQSQPTNLTCNRWNCQKTTATRWLSYRVFAKVTSEHPSHRRSSRFRICTCKTRVLITISKTCVKARAPADSIRNQAQIRVRLWGRIMTLIILRSKDSSEISRFDWKFEIRIFVK